MEKIKYILPIFLLIIISCTLLINFKSSHATTIKPTNNSSQIPANMETNWYKTEVALNEVAKKDSKKYTDDTWQDVERAAQKIKEKKNTEYKNITQEELDKLTKELTTALNNLELK